PRRLHRRDGPGRRWIRHHPGREPGAVGGRDDPARQQRGRRAMSLFAAGQRSPSASLPAASDFMSEQVALSDAGFELFRNWLLRVSGIGLAPGKKAMVAGRLGKRVRQLGLGSYEDYHRLVLSQPGEAQL